MTDYTQRLALISEEVRNSNPGLTNQEVFGAALEVMILELQELWIKEKYGQKASDAANYGWFVDGDAVSTKVYGHGVLTSSMAGGEVKHDWEDR